MAHRLAVMAGEPDVEGLLRRITAKQFQRWQHYYEIEPFGAKRDNYHAAQVVKALLEVHGAKGIKLEDLLLRFEPVEAPKPRQTPQMHLAIAHALATVYNPSVKAKDL